MKIKKTGKPALNLLKGRKSSAPGRLKLFVLLFTFCFLLSTFNSFSQSVGINATGAVSDISAILDISSTTQGVLIPRLTDAQRQALKDPATGLIIFNLNTNEINFYDGTGWQNISGNSVSTTSAAGTGPGGGTGINTTGAMPDPSAILDISDTGRGLLIPRTTQGSVIAVTGLIIYNTTTNKINYYDGSSWQVPCSQLIDNIKGTGAVAEGVAINATGAAADASAMLDVSSFTKGLLIPRMTSAQRDGIQTPAQGLIIYNNNDNRIENWIGTAWYEWMYSVPAQPGAITGTSSVCQSQNGVAYSVTNVAGVTYTWTYSGAGFTIATGSGTNAITANFSAAATSGTLTVTPGNACGNGTAQTMAITVNTIPAQPSVITGTSPVCQSQNGVAYSVTNVAGVTYTWTYSGAGFTIATGSGTNAITANFSAAATSGTLTVTPGNACGNGTAQTMAITVNTVPAQPSVIAGTSPVCQSQNGVAYSVTNVAGVTYTWTYSGAGFTIATGSGTNSITADFSAAATSGTLTVTPGNSCGNGTIQTMNITVNTNSTAATSASANPNPACTGQTVTLSCSGGSLGTGASWVWYSDGCGAAGGGTYVGTGNPFSFTPSTTGTFTYYVRAEGPPCNPTNCVSTAVVTVNSLPFPPTLKPASDITSTSFQANWFWVSDNVILYVSTSSTFIPLLPGYPITLPACSDYVVTGLNPNTTYYYKIQRQNSCGTSNSVLPNQSVTTLP